MAPDLERERSRATAWFAQLQDRLTAALEAIEEDGPGNGGPGNGGPGDGGPGKGGAAGRFQREPWQRPGGGGGTMAILRGRVLEKAGVNVSTVWGEFAEPVRAQIPGAAEDPRFWAAGISVVVHPRSPRVPAAHMNTRMIVTTKRWYGGGADMTPVVPVAADTAEFHAALRAACEAHPPGDYPRFKRWCDEYFFLPHRGEARGVGGIFFDDLDSGDADADFAFVQAVGTAFADVYPGLVRRHMAEAWTAEERRALLVKRGRYVEFNLLFDRGTRFGILTGGNPEAVLMSLPPEVAWP